MSKTYSEVLTDRRWGKKRLEILTNNDFECADCGHCDHMNHIHHLFYENGLNPWEYPDNSLVVLCKDCHESEEDNLKDASDKLFRALRRQGLRSWEIEKKVVEISKLIQNG